MLLWRPLIFLANESQETLEIFSSPLPNVGTPKRIAIEDVEYSQRFVRLLLPPCSPQRHMELAHYSGKEDLSPFASYLKQGDYEMQDALISEPYFDEQVLAEFPK